MPLISQGSPTLKALITYIQKNAPAKRAEQLITFVTQQYSSTADEDLAERSLENLYGAILSQWELMENRKPHEIKCHIYNPTVKTHGWHSPHTIIELCQLDRPFLVDSLLTELNRLGVNIHFVAHSGRLPIIRDAEGKLLKIFPQAAAPTEHVVLESCIYVEVDHQLNKDHTFKTLKNNILRIMRDVTLVTDDFPIMRQKLQAAIKPLENNPSQIDEESLHETLAFLRWMDTDHFTFLGYVELKLSGKGKRQHMQPVHGTGLGLLREPKWLSSEWLNESFVSGREQVLSSQPILISKSTQESPVHRGVKLDVIAIKHFDGGKVVGESCVVGLYTSSAYNDDIMRIPLLRLKADKILRRSGYSLNAHDGKTLFNVLNSFPRDELFQIGTEELFHTAMRMMQIQECQKVRLFLRKETFGRYFYCMVFVPKEIYTNELRVKIQQILMNTLQGKSVIYTPYFMESVLCRIDYIISVDPENTKQAPDAKTIEQQVILVAKDWQIQFKNALLNQMGETPGTMLYLKYQQAFSASYKEEYTAQQAAADVDTIEQLLDSSMPLSMYFYCETAACHHTIRLKIFHKNIGLPLTTVLPILENMGLKVIEERPHQVNLHSETSIWISDFGLQTSMSIDLAKIEPLFKAAFLKIWLNQAENDGFNRLIVLAGLSWREVLILRACAKYLLQIGFRYSQSYMETALTENPALAKLLVALFCTRFDPSSKIKKPERLSQLEQLQQQLQLGLQHVTNLDHDRILQRYVHVILAMLRTNYFQKNSAGEAKEYVSFKLSPAQIPEIPKPIPKYEIFVFSRSVEAVHLRMSDVARGGLRWSDRFEDFRTEVLSLMKAQQVKNAVIVPMGAKGGFIVKSLQPGATREEIQQHGIACYKMFIRALLDITDNVIDHKIIPPKQVIRYDADDPYLVVAADKGTASFSDIANQVSAEYQFWLGDAFASGGSNGYDHKKMGITARGGWESVKRHFMSLGRDIQTTPFTTVGIGDMSGDVFGNAMLLSDQTQLIAAFNHLHIFIDPTPHIAKSFAERQRLFNLPRSTWKDYNTKLISAGGGVYDRQAKFITLSPEAQQCLCIDQQKIEPAELIQAILKAPVDLLWNGGIGTYVKASTETHLEVGDRQNDAVRINGADLRCKVVGEGGNLGFTQRGRVEYALKGGLIHTDAIDNSAGVDCSDHEVNIKILLNELIATGKMTLPERNQLLVKMQDEVAKLVLKNNYDQTQAIANGLVEDSNINDIYVRLVHELSREAGLDRELEMIPSDKEILARKTSGHGLTAPEFAVLMAYIKAIVRRAILNSSLAEDPYFFKYLQAEFPSILSKHYADTMKNHRLARDIIATQVTNTIVKYMGIGFVHRLYDETGASTEMIVRAFEVMSQLFCVTTLWHNIEKLDGKVPASVQHQMMHRIRSATRRSAGWLLRHCRSTFDINTYVSILSPHIAKLRSMQNHLLSATANKTRQDIVERYHAQGVPKALANQVVSFDSVSPVFDIIEIALNNQLSVDNVAAIHAQLTHQLSIDWLKTALAEFAGQDNYWEMLSSSALRDDLDQHQSVLTRCVLASTQSHLSADQRVTDWIEQYQFIVKRWLYLVSDFKTNKPDLVQLITALRCIRDIVDTVKRTQHFNRYDCLATFSEYQK